jgi:RNA polymerase sigma factor (sigma-70 family)
MPHSDAAAVALARDGDSEAFRALVERHSRAVFRVAHRMTGSAQDAEDVVQETFLRAYRQLARFESRANFSTWLHRIAVNCSIDQRESSTEVKKQIIRAVFVGGDAARMTELARAEKDPELRREAIGNLGLMRGKDTAGVLQELYGAEREPEVKRMIVQALYTQGNAEALVGLARREQDTALRTEIVRRLSTMKNKVATDYMLEILGGR